jgi:hypothetical protein
MALVCREESEISVRGNKDEGGDDRHVNRVDKFAQALAGQGAE